MVCLYTIVLLRYDNIMLQYLGQVLDAWFNDCVVGKVRIQKLRKSTPYHIIAYAHVYVCESINCERRKNSHFAINRYSQLKPVLWYVLCLLYTCTCTCSSQCDERTGPYREKGDLLPFFQAAIISSP